MTRVCQTGIHPLALLFFRNRHSRYRNGNYGIVAALWALTTLLRIVRRKEGYSCL